MLKCKICGTEFPAIRERHYIARDNGKTGLSSAFGSNDEEKIYDSFDCPMCGSQIIAQERKRILEPERICNFDDAETDGEGEENAKL